MFLFSRRFVLQFTASGGNCGSSTTISLRRYKLPENEDNTTPKMVDPQNVAPVNVRTQEEKLLRFPKKELASSKRSCA